MGMGLLIIGIILLGYPKGQYYRKPWRGLDGGGWGGGVPLGTVYAYTPPYVFCGAGTLCVLGGLVHCMSYGVEEGRDRIDSFVKPKSQKGKGHF
jgi:hypothetical protein